MLPVLFRLGPFTLYTYGVFLVLAMLAALFVAWKRGRELYFDEKELFDVIFSVVLVMLFTARLGYVITKFEIYGFNIIDWLNVIGKPGILYEAGLLGGLVALYIYARKLSWDFFSLADVLVVSLTMGLIFMSIGAFLNGSGYGNPTDLFVGVTFPGLYEKRHPIQLYSLVSYIAMFILLWRLEYVYRTIPWYRGKKSEAHTGFISSTFLVIHGLIGLMTSILGPGFSVFNVRIDWMFYLIMLGSGVFILVNRSDVKVVEAISNKVSVKRKSKSKKDRRELGKGIIS